MKTRMFLVMAACACVAHAVFAVALPATQRIVSDLPPRLWIEGFPVGTGRLAGMITGDATNDVCGLNHELLWETLASRRRSPEFAPHLPELRRLIAARRFDEAVECVVAHCKTVDGAPHGCVDTYTPAGEFMIGYGTAQKGSAPRPAYRRTLDFTSGCATVESDGVRRVFCGNPLNDLMECFVSAPTGTAVSVTLSRRCSNLKRDGALPEVSFAGGVLKMSGRVAGGACYCVQMRFAGDYASARCADGAKVVFENATALAIRCNVGRGDDPAAAEREANLPAFTLDGFAADRARRDADYAETYAGLASVDVAGATPDVIRYFNFAKHLFLNGARTGVAPLNLQGKWNGDPDPPWWCDYHLDTNLQMCYWPTLAFGLERENRAMLTFLDRMIPTARENARALFGCRGIWLSLTTDASMRSGGGGVWGFSALTVPWLAAHYWQHWRYTRDRAYLRDQAFPFLREAILFTEDFVTYRPDGTACLSPSMSPENCFKGAEKYPVSLCENAAMHVELVAELLDAGIEASEILQADSAERARWKTLRAKIPAPGIGRDGRLLEWEREETELELGHRHMSHLYGVWPGTSIRAETTPALFAAAKKSLEYRLAHGGGHTGWSRAWCACYKAMFGDGDGALGELETLVAKQSSATLLDLHPYGGKPGGHVFQIDGNLGAASAVFNMLLQTARDGSVKLLPALPEDWKASGRVAGIRAPGGLTFSFAWRNGRIERLDVAAREACRLRLTVNGAPRDLSLAAGANAVITPAANRLKLFDVVPYAPGDEAATARDVRETRKTTGLDTYLYCVSLDPRGRPAFDHVEAAVASFRKLKRELGDAPVRLGFLLQSILGHWPRVDKEIEPWQRSIDLDGAAKRFCVLDPRYRDYIRKTAAALAAEHPCFILGDDDIRAFSPQLECFCPLHTAEFNRRAGTAFTPEQYRAAAKTCADGDAVSKVCAQLRDEITLTTAQLVREGIDSVDPAIPAGACMPGMETLLVTPRVKILAGKGNRTTLRFANGKYSELLRNDFSVNALETQGYLADYGADVDDMLDESDTFPHTLYARSGRSFAAKLAVNVFNGIRGAKLWFVGMRKGTERVPEAHARELGRVRPQLEALAAALDGSTPLGVRIPAVRRAPTLRECWYGYFGDVSWVRDMLGVYGIPYCADFSFAPGGPVMICGASTVDMLTDDAIRTALGGRAFVDGPAALRLAKRGFADRLGCMPVADGRAFNVEVVKATGARPPIAKSPSFPALTDPASGVEVYSELRYSPTGSADAPAAFVSPAAVCAKRADGSRVFTAAFDPGSMSGFNNQNLRRKAWLVGALRALDPQFPVVCENAEPNLTFARKGRDGKIYAITLNVGYDDLAETRYSTAESMSRAEVLDDDGTWRPAGATCQDGVWSIPGIVPCMRHRIVRW